MSNEAGRIVGLYERHARVWDSDRGGPALGEAIGSYRDGPLYHASLDGAEYRLLLDGIGFKVVAQINEDPLCGRHTGWLARRG
jgi:hypothetical protein